MMVNLNISLTVAGFYLLKTYFFFTPHPNTFAACSRHPKGNLLRNCSGFSSSSFASLVDLWTTYSAVTKETTVARQQQASISVHTQQRKRKKKEKGRGKKGKSGSGGGITVSTPPCLSYAQKEGIPITSSEKKKRKLYRQHPRPRNPGRHKHQSAGW